MMRNPARRAPALALPFVAVPLCSLSFFQAFRVLSHALVARVRGPA